MLNVFYIINNNASFSSDYIVNSCVIKDDEMKREEKICGIKGGHAEEHKWEGW